MAPSFENPIDLAATRLIAEWSAVQARQEVLRDYLHGKNRQENREKLLALESTVRVRLDGAVESWAAGNGVPLLDAPTAYLFYARIQQAVVFSDWIRDHAEFPGKSTEQILTFLLCDYWYKIGLTIWVGQLRDLE